MALLKEVLTSGILLISSTYIYAQGCSDAGFCSIAGLKATKRGVFVKANNNQIKLGLGYGEADNNINVTGGFVEYQKEYSAKLSFGAKLSLLSQNGNNVSVAGISDLLVNASVVLAKRIRLTSGFKFPLQMGNKKKDNLPLPLDYQASLGTFDFLLGFDYTIKDFKLAAGIQLPLSQNDNEFIAASYQANSPLSKFQSTKGFTRAGDVVIRASYTINMTKGFSITPSLLPIIHIANDTYTDMAGTKQIIYGSGGTTLNSNLFLTYAINTRNSIEAYAGAPLATRKARPDGLTRHFVAGLEYSFKF